MHRIDEQDRQVGARGTRFTADSAEGAERASTKTSSPSSIHVTTSTPSSTPSGLRAHRDFRGENATPESIDRGQPEWLDREAYPFRSRWLRLPDGDAMHYVDEGEGEAVVFVHGTPTWSFEWRHLIRAFSSQYRCIAPDHLGFGLSDRPRDGAYTPDWHARNLSAFVDALGLERFTLVVHDYGGPIALPLAFERPERVTRLVLMNTWAWSIRGDRGMEGPAKLLGGGFGRFLYRRLNLSLRTILPKAYADRGALTPAIHRQYLAPFPDAWSRGTVLWRLAQSLLGSSAYYESLWAQRDRLRGIPTHIIWGMADPAFKPHNLARWREAVPDAEVTEIAAGHWPQEEKPTEVVAALRDFLRNG